VNAALLAFTKALAELGIADGVQVNLINPGTIRTARFTGRLEQFAAERKIPAADAEREYVTDNRIVRVGEPEDIAALVAFVASAEGRLFHGSLIDMDAGATKSI
jgi:3-oxoacyl-[acyl-carrier protein] reductase